MIAMLPALAFLAILIVLAAWVIGLYNGLVRLRNGVKNAWSQIDVQLKRRYDLVPNLVETVKGYASHERDTLEAVIKARQQAIDISSDSVAEQAKAENMLSQTLRSLFALSESYPDLKANQNFLALQEELTSTENKISFARQHYNDSAMTYNNKTEVFPSNLVANTFNFEPADFFEIEEEVQREAPKVSFS
jgi:LemA protein